MEDFLRLKEHCTGFGIPQVTLEIKLPGMAVLLGNQKPGDLCELEVSQGFSEPLSQTKQKQTSKTEEKSRSENTEAENEFRNEEIE